MKRVRCQKIEVRRKQYIPCQSEPLDKLRSGTVEDSFKKLDAGAWKVKSKKHIGHRASYFGQL